MAKLEIIRRKEGTNKTDGRPFVTLTFAHIPQVSKVRKLKLDANGVPMRDAEGRRVFEDKEVVTYTGNGKSGSRTVWEGNSMFAAEVGDEQDGAIVTRSVDPYKIMQSDGSEKEVNIFTTVVFAGEDDFTVFSSQKRAIAEGVRGAEYSHKGEGAEAAPFAAPEVAAAGS